MTEGRFLAVIAIAILAIGCGPSTAARMSPSSVPSPSESPSPSLPVSVLYQPVYAHTDGPIHQVTIQGPALADRVAAQNSSGLLAASTAKYAVVVVPRAKPTTFFDGQQLGVIDLDTGMLRVIDTGPGESLVGWISPDQTKVLVEQQIGTTVNDLVVDPTSGAITTLAADGLSLAYPIRWTALGIIFGTANGVLEVDPLTAAVTRVGIDGQIMAASPNGTYLGGLKNVSSADPNWCFNSIFLTRLDSTLLASGARQGVQNSVISLPNKNLTIVDIADDGSVVYTQSDCGPGPTAPTLTSTLYYFAKGRPTQQFVAGSDSWQGNLLDNSSAILERRIVDSSGGVVGAELDLVKMCTYDGCQPGLTVVAPDDTSLIAYAFSVSRPRP